MNGTHFPHVRTEVLLSGPQGQRWPRAGIAKGRLNQKDLVRPTEVVEYEIQFTAKGFLVLLSCGPETITKI